jgi:putative flavoprotein involved in K+ transport
MQRGRRMPDLLETVIVGGGQGGLCVSYWLSRHARPHVVLEQADRPANAWRNHRWDSFTLNTPNWQTHLPGAPYDGPDPDGFMTKDQIVAYLEGYAERHRLPVTYGTRVVDVQRDSRCRSYTVGMSSGASVRACNVVIATGLYQGPRIPASAADLPRGIEQLHSDRYRSPAQLPSGAVLVVGSAQTGCQIAEELNESGRRVYLCVGRSGRMPRRYRGRDSCWWSDKIGLYARTVDKLPSPGAKFFGKPHLSGGHGGHTINLHQFACDGIVLLGHLRGVREGAIVLADDLKDNLASADKFEADFTKAVDDYVALARMAVPSETLPVLRDGFDRPPVTELDLRRAGIATVIWATSYSYDFSLVKLPILDSDGYPIQERGATHFGGLYFVGLPWLHDAKSGLLYGVGEDAACVAGRIATDARRGSPGARPDAPERSWPVPEICCA